MNHNDLLALRSTGWAMIWVVMFPELIDFSLWHENPLQLSPLLLKYILSALLLETAYRGLAWRCLIPSKAPKVSFRSSFDKHSWIELAVRYPDHSEMVNVLCADGEVRTGRAVERADGRRSIIVEITNQESKLNDQELWKVRPTHWQEAEAEEMS